MSRERAAVFVDGNNWYHGLRDAGLTSLGRLNYAKVSTKIVGARDWTSTRYYVGRVQQTGAGTLYAEQRHSMAWLEARDKRVSVHYGRLERRQVVNEFASEVKRYLGGLTVRIDQSVHRHLVSEATRHESTTIVVEKAVDVMLAVDMVVMAERNQYDVAYLLSADGDYTPAALAVGGIGKKVFAASIRSGAELAAAVYRFIPLRRDWFKDCFGE